ncbi:MAG: hypothetical protein L0J61_04510 [Psychrobacter sp.]|nr:hypothetical protein [Psychrobacter sp.]MDN6276286.1 hypothetical protein [Psychrobacter sp.]MDN6307829.1 hypothetical protein [Psychrobacter sp.]
MWAFYKFMYPRPPKSMMPKEGDVVTPRNCSFCGHSLAEYRGVLETKPVTAVTDPATDCDSSVDEEKSNQELFFCNYEHQADFHAGKVYKEND